MTVLEQTHSRRRFLQLTGAVGATAALGGVLQACNVIGGGDWSENRIVPDIMRALARDQDVVLRNPSAVRPWQHVLDPVSTHDRTIRRMRPVSIEEEP